MSLMSFLTGLPAPAVYGTVAALVGVESIGIPVPGETALITGALIGSHPAAAVSLLGVFLAAWLGAVLGDTIGYMVGRRHGAKLFARLGKRFPRQFSPAHLRFAEHLFDHYGTAAVFGGWFVALLRILAGPLAGSLHLPYPPVPAGQRCWGGGVGGRDHRPRGIARGGGAHLDRQRRVGPAAGVPGARDNDQSPRPPGLRGPGGPVRRRARN